MKIAEKIVLFALLLCVAAALSALYGRQRDELELYARREQLARSSAMGALTRSLREIESGLHESVTMSSPQKITAAAARIAASAATAKAAIDSMPQDDGQLYELSRYVVQVGDYAVVVAGETARDGQVPQEGRQRLTGLLGVTEAVLAAASSGEADGDTASSLSEAAAAAGYDRLYYDGAMSDHMLAEPAYAGLYGLEEVDAQQAMEAAAAFLGVESVRLTQTATGTGSLPVYGFGMDELYIEVTMAGGIVSRMTNGREIGEPAIEPEAARAAAAEFARAAGYDGMVETGHRTAAGVTSVQLCYEGEGVLYYPDAVTVTIALDGGDVVGFDATEFLRCHPGVRTSPNPAVLKSKGEALAPAGHTVSGSRYAVVASEGGLESHAIELATRNGDYSYLYYVDAALGSELSLSRVFEDEYGRSIE